MFHNSEILKPVLKPETGIVKIRRKQVVRNEHKFNKGGGKLAAKQYPDVFPEYYL